jgi:hypothetical protein
MPTNPTHAPCARKFYSSARIRPKTIKHDWFALEQHVVHSQFASFLAANKVSDHSGPPVASCILGGVVGYDGIVF